MDDFFQLIRSRHSIRAYEPTDVEDADLKQILLALNLAPTAGDLQAYEIVVVRDKNKRKRLAEAAHEQKFVADAPVVIAFFMNPARARKRYGKRGEHLYAFQDAAIAATYAQLAAHALGLGSVWVGDFDDDEVCEALDVPPGLRPAALLVIGHPAEAPEATPRRSLDDLVRWDTFG